MEKQILHQDLVKVISKIKSTPNDVYGGINERFAFFLSACECENLEVCQACLDAGIDINIKETEYNTTLMQQLVEGDNFTTKVADWLIEKGIDIYSRGCMQNNLALACKKGNLEAVRYFIKKGMKMTWSDNRKSVNELQEAVYGKNPEIVKLLLDSGWKVTDEIFREAVDNWKRQNEIVELFLQNGADPNLKIGDKPLLLFAMEENDIELVKLLLKYHANPNATVKKEETVKVEVCVTPMDYAVKNKNTELQKVLAEFSSVDSSNE